MNKLKYMYVSKDLESSMIDITIKLVSHLSYFFKKNLEEIQNQTAIGKIEKRSKYLEMSRNVSKCLEMSQSASKCLEVSRNVSKCLEMSRSISKCLEMFEMSRYVSK